MRDSVGFRRSGSTLGYIPAAASRLRSGMAPRPFAAGSRLAEVFADLHARLQGPHCFEGLERLVITALHGRGSVWALCSLRGACGGGRGPAGGGLSGSGGRTGCLAARAFRGWC